MWPFTDKRHLDYRSIRAWIEGERIPTPITAIQDTKLRDRYIEQFAELRRHLFDQHIKSLPKRERDLLACGQHPSQSHSRAKDAEPYAKRLFEAVRHLGCVESVKLGAYHMDRLVLNVMVLRELTRQELAELPDFFGGFEVKGPIVLADSKSPK